MKLLAQYIIAHAQAAAAAGGKFKAAVTSAAPVLGLLFRVLNADAAAELTDSSRTLKLGATKAVLAILSVAELRIITPQQWQVGSPLVVRQASRLMLCPCRAWRWWGRVLTPSCARRSSTA